jgi:hypothetical protein
VTAALDIGLLKLALKQIETHPETWDQESWRVATGCGTKMCLAGWVCELAGGRWISPTSSGLFVESFDDPATICERWDGVLSVSARSRATTLLGLTREQARTLFLASNTLDDLRRTAVALEREDLARAS